MIHEQFSNRHLNYLSLIALVPLLLIASACGNHADKGAELRDAPNATAALYQSRCLSCHGSELQGRVGNETNLQQVGARLSAEDIAAQIRDGSEDGLMPAFGDQLTEEQITGLSDWLAGKR
ncbi:c-type cytochrome [Paenibacillus sp. strain BS8-2]